MTNLNIKNGQNTDVNNQNIEFGDHKKPEKGHKWIYPWQKLTFMLGKIKTKLGKQACGARSLDWHYLFKNITV